MIEAIAIVLVCWWAGWTIAAFGANAWDEARDRREREIAAAERAERRWKQRRLGESEEGWKARMKSTGAWVPLTIEEKRRSRIFLYSIAAVYLTCLILGLYQFYSK